MTAFAISPALARSTLASRPVRAGEFDTLPAFTPAAPRPPRSPAGAGPHGQAQRQFDIFRRAWADRGRAEEVHQRRKMAGSGHVVESVRMWATQTQQAVLEVIGLEVRERGSCCLTIGQIAYLAGCKERSVQYCLALFSGRCAKAALLPEGSRPPVVLSVEYQPRRGIKSMPNVVTIISKEWLAWLNFQPHQAAKARERKGCTGGHPIEKKDNNRRRWRLRGAANMRPEQPTETKRGAWEGARAGPPSQGRHRAEARP